MSVLLPIPIPIPLVLFALLLSVYVCVPGYAATVSSAVVHYGDLSSQSVADERPVYLTLVQRIHQLSHWTINMQIEIKLIGFNGDGDQGIIIQTDMIRQHLQAGETTRSRRIHSLDTQKQHTPFTVAYSYSVTHAAQTLREELYSAINTHVVSLYPETRRKQQKQQHQMLITTQQQTSTFTFNASSLPSSAVHVPVPVWMINNILHKDYQSSGNNSYTIYLLNPPSPLVDGNQLIKYYYYSTPENSCHVQCWMSHADHLTSSVSKFAWVDLTAGPVTYGPHTYGDGIFTEFSLPRPARMKQKQIEEQHTSRAQAMQHYYLAGLSAELAATVYHTVSPLFTPDFQYFPLPTQTRIKVNLIFIHEQHNPLEPVQNNNTLFPGSTEASRKLTETEEWQLYTDEEEENDDNTDTERQQQEDPALGWRQVIRHLSSLADDLHLSLSTDTYHLHFESCDLCVSAYTHALRSSSSALQQYHRYLDTQELKDWLEHFDHQYWGITQYSTDNTDIDTDTDRDRDMPPVRVLNVFVYDLNTADVVLMDHSFQAVSFPDLVLAVQTRSASASIDYSCNGHGAIIRPRSVTNAVLAACLSSLYGIPLSAAAATYNRQSQSVDVRHMWNIATPDSPFIKMDLSRAQAESTAMPFHLYTQAHRGHLLSRVTQMVSPLLSLLTHLHGHRMTLTTLLTPALYVEFVNRYNVWMMQTKQVLDAISIDDYSEAQEWLTAAQQDLPELINLIDKRVANIRGIIICGGDVMLSSDDLSTPISTHFLSSHHILLSSFIWLWHSFLSMCELLLLLFLVVVTWYCTNVLPNQSSSAAGLPSSSSSPSSFSLSAAYSHLSDQMITWLTAWILQNHQQTRIHPQQAV